MGLLDDDYVAPFTPRKSKKYQRDTVLSQELRDSELNNEGHDEVKDDFSDSPFLNY